MSENIYTSVVSRDEKEIKNGYKAKLFWLTGLSGAGKSTLADLLSRDLFERGINNIRLDGDIVRRGLCSDLGFSPADRQENIRRISELSKLIIESGVVVIGSFISPKEANRQLIRKIVGSTDYYEIYCKCSLSVCEGRDVKGLYAKARKGEIEHFTGIGPPYEEPSIPSLILNTEQKTIADCQQQLLEFVFKKIN